MTNLDFEEEINLINNNKIKYMNDEISQSPNIQKDNFGPIEATENIQVKEFKFIRLIMFSCFIFLGFINHIGYYLILTSSQQFASKLGNESLIALYPLALIFFNSFTRIMNSKYFINISYFIRVIFLSLYFCTGFISMFFILNKMADSKNNNTGFWLTMIPAIILGTGESLGEVTILGYIATFKGNYVSGFNVGSSLAGVSGSLLSLLIKKFDINLKNVYLFLTLFAVLYLFVFMITICGYKEKKNYKKGANYVTITGKNEPLNCKNVKLGISFARFHLINLALTNFLQYTICYCFCERANKYDFIKSKNEKFKTAQYETFLLIYEIGVVLSNSCLFLIKYIKYLEIFTYLQVINFILWFFEALYGYISNQWICFIHLFFVGICAGGSSVGILDNLFETRYINPNYKELCLNICEYFMDWAILFSSIISLIFDNTFLKTK